MDADPQNTSRAYPIVTFAVVDLLLGAAAAGYRLSHPTIAEGVHPPLVT
ncbi:MAG: hypothetical protein J07HX5_00343 [halophilic archaeon J07HX5]|nr:MAG: hypothetical protein J07HX5_00343 [halophilic archaeon J07HX5]